MATDERKPAPGQGEARRQRLDQALRANLRRRKTIAAADGSDAATGLPSSGDETAGHDRVRSAAGRPIAN